LVSIDNKLNSLFSPNPGLVDAEFSVRLLMVEIEGFILLGGASSRMGTDKSRLDLGGKQFVDRIASALSFLATKVSVVGAKDSASGWQLPFVSDIYEKWGALGGLHAALASCKSEWAAIVACDLPFVSGELFVRLASLRENFDSVVPIQYDGRLQPLCALYRCTPCLPVAVELIENGERRPRELFKFVNTRLVAMSELSTLSNSRHFFMNVNTVEDYELAKAVMGDR
jgi:molybdopterin-guanine dinucleotide biosynthesis protein A